jgi:hypothetical protein
VVKEIVNQLKEKCVNTVLNKKIMEPLNMSEDKISELSPSVEPETRIILIYIRV